MINARWAWPILAGVLLFSACKQRLDKAGDTKSGVPEMIAKHRASTSEFHTLLLKGKADYYDEAKKENISFSYKISIAKDSLIAASISKLGLPAANMLVDLDSVRMRLPLSKEGILCDFDVLSSMVELPLDFKTLQDFLVGNAQAGLNAIPVEPVSKPLVLQEQNALGLVSYTVGSDHGKLEKMVAKGLNIARESTLEYGEFRKVDGKWMPGLMRLTTTRPETTRIELKHTDIEIDGENTNFSFRIPEGYEIKPCKPK